MKYKIGDKVFNQSTLELWDNRYCYKDNNFEHEIKTVKTASEERFSTQENVDLNYPSLGEYVYLQTIGDDIWGNIYGNKRLLHIEEDKELIHELISQAYIKSIKEADEAKLKEIQRIKDWIESYEFQLYDLLENDTPQQKLIKERYQILRDTIFK